MSTSTSATHTHFRAPSRNLGSPAREGQGQEGPTITSFACDVAAALQGIARELSKETGTKAFCSLLAAALDNARENLRGLDEGLGNIPDVPKLLDNLERLCQVSWSMLQK